MMIVIIKIYYNKRMDITINIYKFNEYITILNMVLNENVSILIINMMNYIYGFMDITRY